MDKIYIVNGWDGDMVAFTFYMDALECYERRKALCPHVFNECKSLDGWTFEQPGYYQMCQGWFDEFGENDVYSLYLETVELDPKDELEQQR